VIDAVASRIIVLWGWRRLLLAFLAGAASALAMPPYDLFPVLLITLPVLVWLIDGTVGPQRRSRIGAAIAVGWAFGFGYFLAGLWWVGAAFLVEADVFGWMLPIAIVLLPGGLALFPALAAGLARLFWRNGPQRIFILALFLSLSELARGVVLTGFPWNAFGYALTGSPVLMQSASLFGINGLTVLTLFIFASPAALSGGGSRRARVCVPALGLVLFAAIAGYGVLRLSQAQSVADTGLTLRIVQPAIPQAEKWQPENRNRIFADYLTLSDTSSSPETAGIGGVDMLIWPESALPFLFDFEPGALPAIAALLPPETTLITGMQRLERDPPDPQSGDPQSGDSQAGEGVARIYNSVMLIDHQGTILDIYDKAWLVPFGEFLPFQSLLESVGLRQLTNVIGGFSAGPGPKSLSTETIAPFAPLVCYEAIFTGAFVDMETRPDWILNVTNDAWFGDSPGPWQHLRQARLRAVEEGLPLVRAANNGISAVVDPYGRIVSRLGLDVRGVIDSTLPGNLPTTRFRKSGGLMLSGLLLVLAVGGFFRYSAKKEGE